MVEITETPKKEINRYRKGADKERRYVNGFKRDGLISFRSAGSHSPIDVCAIDIANKKVLFIQCKAGYISDNEKNRLRE